MYIYIYIYYRTGAGIRPLILHVDLRQKRVGGRGVYPISPGYKPLQTKIRVNTTSISAMIHKKHIYRFVLHTAVHSSTEKTTVFSGRLRLYYRHRHKNANFSKQIVVLPAKTVVAAILYASVGNE